MSGGQSEEGKNCGQSQVLTAVAAVIAIAKSQLLSLVAAEGRATGGGTCFTNLIKLPEAPRGQTLQFIVVLVIAFSIDVL